MWYRWLLAQPEHWGAPEVVLSPQTVVCGARRASGWVFAGLLTNQDQRLCGSSIRTPCNTASTSKTGTSTHAFNSPSLCFFRRYKTGPSCIIATRHIASSCGKLHAVPVRRQSSYVAPQHELECTHASEPDDNTSRCSRCNRRLASHHWPPLNTAAYRSLTVAATKTVKVRF